MYSFTKKSKINLSQAHPDLQTLFNEVIKEANCYIICGHRGEVEQNDAFDRGNSLLRFPNSKHNKLPSLAVDATPRPLDWNDLKGFDMLGEIVLRKAKELKESGDITHDIVWGGMWKKFKDRPHYEIKT